MPYKICTTIIHICDIKVYSVTRFQMTTGSEKKICVLLFQIVKSKNI